MIHHRPSIAAAFAFLFFMLLPASVPGSGSEAGSANYFSRATDQKTFEEVILDLELTITQRNFAIVGRNDVGEAIRSRGYPKFPDTRIIHFCNVGYAHEALTIDPALIVYMPCRIAVFERGGRVHLATMMLPDDSDDPEFNAFARKINRVMREMIDYAVSGD